MNTQKEIPLANDTKIKFCIAFHAMQKHLGDCGQCCEYLYHGDGDLCDRGKDVICEHMTYANTDPQFSK